VWIQSPIFGAPPVEQGAYFPAPRAASESFFFFQPVLHPLVLYIEISVLEYYPHVSKINIGFVVIQPCSRNASHLPRISVVGAEQGIHREESSPCTHRSRHN
jgi:hypothetical protein